MGEIQYSELLTKIMDRAEALCKEKECSSLTRDYIIIAAIAVTDEAASSGQDVDEYIRTKNLLSGFTRDRKPLESVLEKWQKKEIPYTEKMILLTKKGKSFHLAKLLDKKQLTADIFLAEILKDSTPGISELKTDKKEPATIAEKDIPTGQESGSLQGQERMPASTDVPQPNEGMKGIVNKTKALQTRLQEVVLGQQHAVGVFASGYFQSELQAAIEKDRKRPRATFLFAGPPGVGKTFLSEEAARILQLPFCRFDMSEYTGPNATDELSGSDANYKASSEGLLTGFVNKHPQCVLLFDEIEKASLDVIHLFLQILDAGRLRDNRTDKEISFKDTILIFTTNAGKALYEDGDNRNLSSVSRDVILDALANDINPKTKEPYFPAAICSRFAAGNVIMFNHLEADSLRAIIARELEKHVKDIDEALDVAISIDKDVITALLLAEGAMADARTVKSRASSFFGSELYELYRLIDSEKEKGDVDTIRKISMYVNRDQEEETAVSLFSPSERIHAIAYAKKEFEFTQPSEAIPIIHYVQTFEEAKHIIAKENIQLVFCDLFSDDVPEGKRYLNQEDRDTKGRSFLQAVLTQYPMLPVVLTETEVSSYSEEEKISYLRKGVSGFLQLCSDDLEQKIGKFTEKIFQQNCMTELARSNRLLKFETAQSVDVDGRTADIVLYDLKLEKAIKAEDAGNIMSLLSTPDVRFDDVIGADDAKNELQFFVSYMQNPKKYRRAGVSSPKGVLLYGPPGTGKTMLAKAFAAESGATFIATEGNQFFKGIVGQGAAMVHQLFAMARRYAPSVIFIDEIDTIARARTGRDTDLAQDNEQILTALFSEMDGFSSKEKKPVFVLAATNYGVDPGAQMKLDPAILRRFDRWILVDLPNLENRKKYLMGETSKKSIFHLSEDILSSLADRSTGMSLAQLSSILDMSIRNAVQKHMEYVDDSVIDDAFETFNSGESKKWGAETTLRTARHEAGHAIVSWLAGEKPSFVTIISRSNFGGYMQYADQENRMGYTKRELLRRIRTALGGRAAEMVYYGNEEGLSTGASGDLKTATELASQLLCKYGMDEQFGLAVVDKAEEGIAAQVQSYVNDILKRELAEAIQQINKNKGKMDALVSALLKYNSLKQADIDKIMANAII